MPELTVEEVEEGYVVAKEAERLGEHGLTLRHNQFTMRLCIGYVEMKVDSLSRDAYSSDRPKRIEWQSLLTKLKGEVKE